MVIRESRLSIGDSKLLKMYKRAQTLSALKFNIENMKELYNDPSIHTEFHLPMTTAQQRWAKLRRVLLTIFNLRHA